jgi:hypothetical protein
LGLLGLALLWSSTGCATVEEKFDKLVDHLPEKVTFWSKPAASVPGYHYHDVLYPGETLSIIAEWYTGDGENWRALAKLNPKLNPNHISIGAKIRVPEKLLLNHKRMPEYFVKAAEKRREAEKARLGNVEAPPRAKPDRPKPTCHIHNVRYPGETLSIIARWYTGNGENWHALTKVNPQLDPNHLIIGSEIRIPRNLLSTKKPMPRDFIVLSRPASEPTPSSAALSKAEASEEGVEPPAPSQLIELEIGEMELFGPR